MTFLLMSSKSSNFTVDSNFQFRKQEKSQGPKSNEFGGCCTLIIQYFAETFSSKSIKTGFIAFSLNWD